MSRNLILVWMKRINQFGHFVLSEIRLTRLTKINEYIILTLNSIFKVDCHYVCL